MYWTSSLPQRVELFPSENLFDFGDFSLNDHSFGNVYYDRTSKFLINPPTVSNETTVGDSSQVKFYFVSLSLCSTLALKVRRDNNSIATTMTSSQLFGVSERDHQSLEVLVSGDQSGVITLSAYGYFPIGCIDLSGAFCKEQQRSKSISSGTLPKVRCDGLFYN